jgi:hypothetical protein
VYSLGHNPLVVCVPAIGVSLGPTFDVRAADDEPVAERVPSDGPSSSPKESSSLSPPSLSPSCSRFRRRAVALCTPWRLGRLDIGAACR